MAKEHHTKKKVIIIFLFFLSTVFSANAQTTIKEKLEQHVYTLASDSLQGRKAGTIYARKAANYIAKQFEEIGIEPYFHHSYFQPFGKNNKYQNVIGVVRGSDPALKDEYIVVGAHYDHLGTKSKQEVYSGADDNASGVAAMIEVGRELKRIQSDLKRSVMFIAFDAEEEGLLGSIHFVHRSDAPIANIKLMISPDMIGWYHAKNMVQYVGTGTIKGGNELILNPQLVPENLNVVTKKFELNILIGGDYQPFEQKRIPTLYVNTGLKSPYHQPEDEAHLINYDAMTLITTHLKNIVETVSRDEDFEASGKISPKHKPRQRISYGVSANFGGTMLHYTAGNNDEDEENTGFSFGTGIMSQVNFGCFAIRPELYYDHVRALHPAGTFATSNITVPLSLVLQTPDRSFFGADLFFGGYYSYRFAGKQGKEKMDFENKFNRHESGLTFGFSMFFRPFTLGIAGRLALTDLTKIPDANNAHLQNRTVFLTLRYML